MQQSWEAILDAQLNSNSNCNFGWFNPSHPLYNQFMFGLGPTTKIDRQRYDESFVWCKGCLDEFLAEHPNCCRLWCKERVRGWLRLRQSPCPGHKFNQLD